ncbi:protein CcmA, bactofilin family [Rubritalea squalenifaciens DSM 18772]|uniref:Protein CcmA, bactofilin family n=3 Tax=Rubritalea TaxID=361050 RepID=A0A1M6L9V9_9BACT|nr:protein CcmA, bactofilin family [Rubritalea squalenifaciens DSM 18772]
MLSSDVEIKGRVKFTNDLVVDGKIEGEIDSDGSLTVGENARVRAEIRTRSVVIYGKVHGNITVTDRVEIKANAELVGDIKAATLSIEAGAIFVGKSTVGAPSAGAATPSSSDKKDSSASSSKKDKLAAAS